MKHILLVEDNLKVRNQLAELLSSANYQVTTAINGLDGLATATRSHFDLFIVDHLMPLMDGPKLINNLQNHPKCNNTPTILLSTQNSKQRAYLSASLNCEQVFSKPVEAKSLLAQLEATFNVQTC